MKFCKWKKSECEYSSESTEMDQIVHQNKEHWINEEMRLNDLDLDYLIIKFVVWCKQIIQTKTEVWVIRLNVELAIAVLMQQKQMLAINMINKRQDKVKTQIVNVIITQAHNDQSNKRMIMVIKETNKYKNKDINNCLQEEQKEQEEDTKWWKNKAKILKKRKTSKKLYHNMYIVTNN